MRYDIYGDGATGHYKIIGNYINLYYDVDKIDTPLVNALSSRNKNGRINCLYFQNNKLFNCDSTGKVFRVYHTKVWANQKQQDKPALKTRKAKYYFKKGRIFN
jgi:hypothetical protein